MRRRTQIVSFRRLLLFAVIALFNMTAPAQTIQSFSGHVPPAVGRLHLQPIGRLPGSQRLNLVIGLPLRNQPALADLLAQIYDPASTNYHHYLTPEQFTERFGPTKQDYQAAIAFRRRMVLQ
jgi:subtilase family serine protease